MLFQRSIEVILSHQAPTGAYPASPTFPVYRYSWFRDGAFIAYAMDVVGEHESARRFHDWAARTILRYAEVAERAIQKAIRGEPLGADYIHTRYTLDGQESSDEWPNFQLDGLGTWLWALYEHVQRTKTSPPSEWHAAAALTARYLAALWTFPCYDLWEEHPQYLHPYTLSAIYAGLRAAGKLIPEGRRPLSTGGRPPSAIAHEIRDFVLRYGVQNGHLVKHITPPGKRGAEEAGARENLTGAAEQSSSGDDVDASLIGIATPYRLLVPDDPIMQATVARIETDLHCPGGGVHRYLDDTYYGGGEWVLLTAWLGWYYAELGDKTRAAELLRWVEAQADSRGDLPEQVSAHLLAPDYYAEWEARWGPVAKPLLWSHAMYLILHQALGVTDQE